MLSFLNLLKEKRKQLGKYLVIVCAFLLALLQVYTIFEICSSTHKESKDILYNTLLTKTIQLNTTKSPSAPYAMFAHNHNKNFIKIRKGETIDTTIYLSKNIDIPLITCKGSYDARDTNLWSLDSLGGLLKTTSKDQAFSPPFTLRLTDKDGKTLETYEYHMSSLPAWTYRFEVPLGFLDHHHLSAKLVYPVSHLWSEIWDKVITTLSLAFLFAISLRSLSQQLKKEKKRSAFRKVSAHRMVHDLRSPMMFIIQQLPTLIGADPNKQKEIVDKCLEKIHDMLDNISYLLSASMNAYKLETHKELYDLNLIINKVVEDHKDSCDDKHIRIMVDNQITESVYIDQSQIQGALGNLVDNSVKYSGSAPLIKICCCIKDECLILSVEDNGIGIPQEEHEKIFDNEHRVEPKKDFIQPKGYGIGLHYVQSVALAHKGAVSVKSDGELGSIFTLEIPQTQKK